MSTDPRELDRIRELSLMLSHLSSQWWEIGLDYFMVGNRPCRPPQEKITGYSLSSRPIFHWEEMRRETILGLNEEALNLCSACPLNIFSGFEGCQGKIADLNVFFRAIEEHVPDSPWLELSIEGEPSSAAFTRTLLTEIPRLQSSLSKVDWACASLLRNGEKRRSSFGEEPQQEAPLFFAWNGDPPPSIIASNDGYVFYMSQFGFLVKPVFDDPIPHAFRRIVRNEEGMFGLTSSGDKVFFDIVRGLYPTWYDEPEKGDELVLEALPGNIVFREIFDVLEVFCSMAVKFDTGIWVRRPKL